MQVHMAVLTVTKEKLKQPRCYNRKTLGNLEEVAGGGMTLEEDRERLQRKWHLKADGS